MIFELKRLPNDEGCAQVVSRMSQEKEAILWMIEPVNFIGSEHRITAKALQKFSSTLIRRNPKAKREESQEL